MNRSIRKVAIALTVLLAALFVNLNYVQVVKGSDYRDDPNNRRVLLNEYASPRGPIVVQGTDIAKSKATSDELKYLRSYPQGTLYATVTGYYSFLYDKSRIEDAEDSVLSGNDNRLFGTRLADILTGRNPQGGSVDLTLNKAAQQAAYTALADSSNGTPRRGAVVAIDPSTGAILAAVSTPTYDPNALSSHNSTEMSHAYACYSDMVFPDRGTGESTAAFSARTDRSINSQLALREGGTTLLDRLQQQDATKYPVRGTVYSTDGTGTESVSTRAFTSQFPSFGKNGCGDVPDDPTPMYKSDKLSRSEGPLHNRAFNELYPPGSTFKTVVAAAALRAGVDPTQEQLISPNAYYPETGEQATSCPTGSTACLENFDGEQCDNGKTATLMYAFAKSCNTTFAALAVERLGGEKVAAEAKRFGFDSDSPLTTPLSVAPSTVGPTQDLSAKGFLARTAFGQQSVLMTPLQGAMLSSAVANSGLLMKPYLVAREVAPDLKVLDETQPEQLSQVLDPAQDAAMQNDLMSAVVNEPEGTGQSARITDMPGVTVFGKTGTADNGPEGKLNPPHAWFTGFATDQGVAKIAVCVLIENGGVQGNETTGGEAAAPVAKAVMEAYLKDQGGN